MSPRFLPKIVGYRRVWRPSPSHRSQRGSRRQLRGKRLAAGNGIFPAFKDWDACRGTRRLFLPKCKDERRGLFVPPPEIRQQLSAGRKEFLFSQGRVKALKRVIIAAVGRGGPHLPNEPHSLPPASKVTSVLFLLHLR